MRFFETKIANKSTTHRVQRMNLLAIYLKGEIQGVVQQMNSPRSSHISLVNRLNKIIQIIYKHRIKRILSKYTKKSKRNALPKWHQIDGIRLRTPEVNWQRFYKTADHQGIAVLYLRCQIPNCHIFALSLGARPFHISKGRDLTCRNGQSRTRSLES